MVATRTRGPTDCRPLLAHPDDLTLVVAPVVDLAGATVAGYEAQARFPGTAGPHVWFAAADAAGLGAELAALMVHKALARLPHVRSAGFLLVGLRADLLGSGPVQEALAGRPRLDGLVVELRGPGGTEGTAGRATDLQARGARIARAPGGPSARWPVTDDLVVLDRDTAGAFAATGLGSVDGLPVLVDGIQTPEDLTAAVRCGAAMGRGWLFGPASATPRSLAPSVTDLVRTRDARVRTTRAVRPLVRSLRLAPADPAPGTPVLEGDGDGTPLTLLVVDGASGRPWRKPVTLAVLPTAGVGEVLRLALGRAPEHRYDPVLCTDEGGRALGLLRVAELVRAAR